MSLFLTALWPLAGCRWDNSSVCLAERDKNDANSTEFMHKDWDSLAPGSEQQRAMGPIQERACVPSHYSRFATIPLAQESKNLYVHQGWLYGALERGPSARRLVCSTWEHTGSAGEHHSCRHKIAQINYTDEVRDCPASVRQPVLVGIWWLGSG